MGRSSGVAAADEALDFGKLDTIPNLVSALEWHARVVESIRELFKCPTIINSVEIHLTIVRVGYPAERPIATCPFCSVFFHVECVQITFD
jgi:hypothetical protein